MPAKGDSGMDQALRENVRAPGSTSADATARPFAARCSRRRYTVSVDSAAPIFEASCSAVCGAEVNPAATLPCNARTAARGLSC